MPEAASSPSRFMEAEDAAFAYGPCTVLDGVSACFAAGRVTALLGPNGAGKSTLLGLLSGERRPTRGRVDFDGRPVASWEPRELARRRAVLPQAAGLSFPFTVEEVVLLGRAPHLRGGERDEDIAACREALRMVDMLPMIGRDYTTLSGGERQRVHLARVLAQAWERRGQALLLDEPVAGLDLSHQHGTLRLAREWAAAGACVVTVLHDLNLALRHADDAVVLAHGRVVAQGPVRDVISEALVREVFAVKARIIDPGDGSRVVITE